MDEYYEKKDLADFVNIGEYAPESGKRYFDYYGEVMKGVNSQNGKNLLLRWPLQQPRNVPIALMPIRISAFPWAYPRMR
jgi:hypothetical protein